MSKLSLFELTQQIQYPEIDYQALISVLNKSYAAPERKLQELQKSGEIIRVKKGFYVINPKKSALQFSEEIVANLVFGPSYLSLQYALSHYNLIPERVSEITSVTLLRNKEFETPIGRFTYQHLSKELYPLSIRQNFIESRPYLIADPEKAVLDYLSLDTSEKDFRDSKEVKSFLCDFLRLDWFALVKDCKLETLETLKSHYQRRKRCLGFLTELIKEYE